MDIRELRYFAAVYRERNLTGSQALLHLAALDLGGHYQP
jgi:DNA-binding transcriptional LysR family regulator